MARTKGFARRTAPASADTETRTGSAPAQEAAQSTPQDEVQQTEYYPITLKWTWQVIENDRNARYRADLEQASVIISARLAGYYVKAEDLEWAKAIGQKEVERDEAEKAAKKQGQEAKRADIIRTRKIRKLRPGMKPEIPPLTASDLAFLDPNVEDSDSTFTYVSDVSNLRPSSRASTDAAQSARLDSIQAGSDHESDWEDVDDFLDEDAEPEPTSQNSVSNANSHQLNELDEENGDGTDWAAEAALWQVGGGAEGAQQDVEGEIEDGDGDGSFEVEMEYDDDDDILTVGN